MARHVVIYGSMTAAFGFKGNGGMKPSIARRFGCLQRYHGL